MVLADSWDHDLRSLAAANRAGFGRHVDDPVLLGQPGKELDRPEHVKQFEVLEQHHRDIVHDPHLIAAWKPGSPRPVQRLTVGFLAGLLRVAAPRGVF